MKIGDYINSRTYFYSAESPCRKNATGIFVDYRDEQGIPRLHTVKLSVFAVPRKQLWIRIPRWIQIFIQNNLEYELKDQVGTFDGKKQRWKSSASVPLSTVKAFL